MKHKISEAFKAVVESIRVMANKATTTDDFYKMVSDKYGNYVPPPVKEDDTPEITEEMKEGAKFPQMPFNDALRIVSRSGTPKEK